MLHFFQYVLCIKLKNHYKFFITVALCCIIASSQAQPLFENQQKFTLQDSLRGTLNKNRNWWDVLHYTVHVAPDIEKETISGSNTIKFRVTNKNHSRYMQIDLQQPMKIDRLAFNGKDYIEDPGNPIQNIGNAWVFPVPLFQENSTNEITVYFSGKPRKAVTPPWDGGWIWAKDSLQRPYITVACQGLGASVWLPCKDHQSDEPDNGVVLSIQVPNELTAVGNGKFVSKTPASAGTSNWTWQVTSPINSYNIIPYIGHYTNWSEIYKNANGTELPLEFWVLDYNKAKAMAHFKKDVQPMIACFEDWFGPYAFYNDGFKLVESSHLGMEHQSAIAYGNKFRNGYMGRDRSGTGEGLDWDFIIIHEAGHEWFGNNITSADIADMWIHEGFTTYSEALYIECKRGRAAGDMYIQGLRRNIQNNRPIIGVYGVNHEGSSDMYDKGANIVLMLREIIDNEALFKEITRGLNKQYFHKTVTTNEIETYISEKSNKNFSKFFDQYLRTNKVPVLEYTIQNGQAKYRWTNCITGFNMPLKLSQGNKWLYPTEEWQQITLQQDDTSLTIDKNFYINTKKL